ncbi:MAG: tRNA lysidine(34) synthetase TilS [Bacteroidota bacterium]
MKRVEQKVLKFVDQYKLIDPGDKILVAFSGGPDSVLALNFLKKYWRKFKIELVAVHFNHGLRGEESDADEKFAVEFCDENGIALQVVSLDVKTFAKKNKLSIEEAARKLRYENLESIAKKLNCNKIVTAHNQSDNTETVLMNLFSGTGLSGLSGIPIRRGKIIRPLLCVTKQEILESLQHDGNQFRIDSSNFSDDFKRNFVRNRILPLVREKINPSIDEALFRSARNVENSSLLSEKLLDLPTRKYVTAKNEIVKIKTSLSELFGGKFPGEILKSTLQKYFKHEFGYDDFEKINSLIGKQKGRKVHLAKDLLAFREEDEIRIERTKESSNRELKIEIGAHVTIGSKTIGVELEKNKNVKWGDDKKTEFISGDNLENSFEIRAWKEGDRFKPIGMKGFKKVSDFLTDEKVPTSERKKQLVLLNRNQIVWVVGLRIDDRFKLNSKTKKVYKLWMN